MPLLKFLPEWSSDIGTILTAVGFLITIWQIRKINHTTSRIEEEVRVTQSQMQRVLAIADLSKSNETIKTIFSYLRQGNYDMAYEKILEINNLIIEIKEVPALRNLIYLSSLEAHGKYLATDLKKLQDILIVEQAKIDKETLKSISNDLQNISDLFAKINAQLKHHSK